jgi:FtsP/CotA-like multicopper oxidase with cupredoxin domain
MKISNLDTNRRRFVCGGLFGLAAIFSARGIARAERVKKRAEGVESLPPVATDGDSGSPPVPVITPDVPKLQWRMEDGVKVFRLVSEVVKRTFLPKWTFDTWGFNGSTPGPTIEVNEGDRVRIILENRLPEATAIHWHGLELPPIMDGTPGLMQNPIPPGGRYIYEFTLHQNGTFFYHSHMAMQEMMGMLGLFIIHPKQSYEPVVDRDYALMMQEWAILPNNTVPNSMSMEFNWLTINGKVGPATTPLLAKIGERVRIRFVNLGMDHHPMHLHGNTFWVTGTEAGRIPRSAWIPGNTVLVGVAQARDIEFDAKYEGDWMVHCHLPHHMMNHMVSMVGPASEDGGMQDMKMGAMQNTNMPAGMGMEEGMGMLRQGSATAKENGPSMGRAMGVGATFEEASSNMVGSSKPQQHNRPKLVPGYPQDMFIPEDAAVAKPETYGMRPTWSGGVDGMMTVMRVLKPELFDKIAAMQARQRGVKG